MLRILWVGAAALTVIVLLTPSGRHRASVWLAAARGGEGAPSLREAVAQTAPWSLQDRVRRLLGPKAEPVHRALETPPPDPDGGPLDKELITLQTTWCCDQLNIHYSLLKAGKTPHEIHQHDDEELLIPISGEVAIVRPTGESPAGPGRLIYHASLSPHTIRAEGSGDASYLVLRWRGSEGAAGAPLEAQVADFRPQLEAGLASAGGGVSHSASLLDGETRFLSRAYVHLRSLEPGGEIAEHEDDHDALMVVLRGVVETQGRRLEAPAASFNPAFARHGFRNPGPGVAQYLAIDLTPR
ncbi:MAG: hypothetical protein GC160_04600 [Acidobacteria bacterium]|nr:hypothetical protein [Acidobacteriota bacterium]